MQKPINDHSVNTIQIETLHQHHPRIRAIDFRSPLVRRLSRTNSYKDGQRTVNNSYRPPSSKIIEENINLSWKGLHEDHDQCINTYQEPVITEMATIGLACVLLHQKANLEITEVTRRGEKADYWIGDKENMLEISGQQDGDISALCNTKSDQLLSNPFSKPGYVCVAIYEEGLSRLWYYNIPNGVTNES